MSCRFPWCSRDHSKQPREHRTAPVELGDLAVIAILIDGHQDEPDGLVRLAYAEPRMLIEFRPAVADEVAYVLDRIEGEHAGRVAAAVRGAARTLMEARGWDL
ncbi:hypothetical protein [Nonomuraea candida]|uniref:hypothetical protein n=1 Tax=Nonomuraea candida TaxID=359159 RepID=UPI0012FC5216|nr:hypothetical protein [Nonomuraea candida]